jgi:hypothetical protein
MRLRKHLLHLALALLMAASSANAAVINQFDANGELTGAKGIVVNGQTYDVVFKEGSCHTLFVFCNATQFAFNTQASAQAASNALMSQVFIGAYDTDTSPLAVVPSLQQTGFQPIIIGAITPYAFGSGATSGRVLISVAQNDPQDVFDDVFDSNIGTLTDTTPFVSDFFAVWSLSNAGSGAQGSGAGGTIPEPGGLALVLAGLGMLGLGKRRLA